MTSGHTPTAPLPPARRAAQPAPAQPAPAQASNDDHQDYTHTRVPHHVRYSWVSVAVQRIGRMSALGQFMLAASIGIGMDFWAAMTAMAVATVILETISILLGIIGVREGLSTSMIARWSGFGLYGSALVGLAIAVSLAGWFAVQNEVFAKGLAAAFPAVPVWAWCVVGGLLVTWIVMYGFKGLHWVAWVTVPAFMALVVWTASTELGKHSWDALQPHAGTTISMTQAITMITGGFIVGAVFTPDMCRFNRSVSDVVKQTVVGVTIGQFFVGTIGVLLAHALKLSAPNAASGVVKIIQSSSATVGVIILAASVIKINDWNLYPSTVAVVNAADGLWRKTWSRRRVTLVIGLLGTALSALSITTYFTAFLTELGIIFPPIAAILIADYFLVRSWRPELDASRAEDGLPHDVPTWVPAGLIAWAVGYVVAKISLSFPEVFASWSIPALTSLLVTGVAYVLVGRLWAGSTRGVGLRPVTSR